MTSKSATPLCEEIAVRVALLRERIARAARRAGRDPSEVTLLGASKQQSPERIAAAVKGGVRCFGENYVQEARDKRARVEALLASRDEAAPLRWHCIGPLQRNKTRDAVRLFDTIESLDRLRLAREIDKRAAAAERVIDVFIQVNLSEEPQKAGVSLEALPALLEACARFEHLCVVGLMTIPAATEEPTANRPVFAQLRELRDSFTQQPGGERLRELSMGMSRDFETAIEEGATLVRVGQDLFGPRPAADNAGGVGETT